MFDMRRRLNWQVEISIILMLLPSRDGQPWPRREVEVSNLQEFVLTLLIFWYFFFFSRCISFEIFQSNSRKNKRISQTIILYTLQRTASSCPGDKNAFNFSREILSRFVNRILLSCILLDVFGEVHKFSLNWLIIFNSNIIIFFVCCCLSIPFNFVQYQLMHSRSQPREKNWKMFAGRRKITIWTAWTFMKVSGAISISKFPPIQLNFSLFHPPLRDFTNLKPQIGLMDLIHSCFLVDWRTLNVIHRKARMFKVVKVMIFGFHVFPSFKCQYVITEIVVFDVTKSSVDSWTSLAKLLCNFFVYSFIKQIQNEQKKGWKKRVESCRLPRLNSNIAYGRVRVRQPFIQFISKIEIRESMTQNTRVFVIQFSDPYLIAFWNFIKKMAENSSQLSSGL